MKRLVLPEGGDERIRAAARRIEAEGIAQPIVLEAIAPERIERYAELYPGRAPGCGRESRAAAGGQAAATTPA